MSRNLFDLPTEIKSLIFEFLFGDLNQHLPASRDIESDRYHTKRPYTTAILLCSKRAREEALPHYYLHATFALGETPTRYSGYPNIPQGLHRIQNARLYSLADAVALGDPSPYRTGTADEYRSPNVYLSKLPFDSIWAKFRETYPSLRTIEMSGDQDPDREEHMRYIYNNKESIRVTLRLCYGGYAVVPPGARIFTNGLGIRFVLFPDRTIALRDKSYWLLKGRPKEEWLLCFEIYLQRLGLTFAEVKIFHSHKVFD